MSRPQFLADEDLRGSIARSVRRLAPDCQFTTAIEQRLLAMPDEQVLQFAWENRWLLVSHDVNTMKGLAEKRIAAGQGIHGLFLVPQKISSTRVAESLVLIFAASQFEEWRDRIVYLPF